jgi:hypothetical protein
MEGLSMVPLPRTQLDAVVLSVVLSAGLSVVEYLHHVVLTPYLCVLVHAWRANVLRGPKN